MNYNVTRCTIVVAQIVLAFAKGISYIARDQVYALQGDVSFYLECYIWADPPVISVEWYFQSQLSNKPKTLGKCPLDDITTHWCSDGDLVFLKISKEDEGYYTCIVDNGEQQINKTTRILATMGPVVIPVTRWFVLGGSGHVKCKVHKDTVFSKLQWKRNGKIKKEKENQRDWLIDEIKKEHAGNYTCMIRTSDGLLENSINIVVVDPPFIVVFGNVTWIPAKQLMGCSVTFDFMNVPQHKIKFELPNSRKLMTKLIPSYNGSTTSVTYVINEANDKDFGCYRCTVVLETSGTYETEKCFWGEGKYVVTILGEYFVKHNQGVLVAKIKPTFKLLYTYWKFNGKKIPGAKKLNLAIESVTKADEGNYSCFAGNEFIEEFRTKFIRVEYRPSVKIHAYTSKGTMDKPNFINCSVDAKPPAREISLDFEGSRIHKFTEKSNAYTLPEGNTLRKGCYDCIARNFYGSGSDKWCYKPYATGPSRKSTVSTRTSLIIWVVSGTVILIALIGTAIGMIRLINRNSSNSVTAFTIGAIHVKSLAIREDFQKMSAAELKRLEDLHDEKKAEDEDLSDTSDEGKQLSETGRQNAAQPDDPFMYRVGSAGSLSHSAGKKKPKRKKIKNAKKLKKMKDSVPKKNNSSSSIIKLPLKTDPADE